MALTTAVSALASFGERIDIIELAGFDERGDGRPILGSGRQERSAALVANMERWLARHRARVAAKSPLGEPLNYIANYQDGLRLFLTDGSIEIDSNSVERAIRPIAQNRKNALFAALPGTMCLCRRGRRIWCDG